MKKHFIITFVLTMLMSMAGANALAYDIAVENSDGVTIYYNYINDGKELEVTASSFKYLGYDGTFYDEYKYGVTPNQNLRYSSSYSYSYSSRIVIPSEVVFMGRTRKVTAIGEYAFTSLHYKEKMYGKKDFSYIYIPSTINKIGKHAFAELTVLQLEIGWYGASKLSNIKTVVIEDIGEWCKIDFGDGLANPFSQLNKIYTNDENEVTNLIIPEGVTSISPYAFVSCSGIKTLTIPSSVTSIGASAFFLCSGLVSITIPNSVTSIGRSAFSGCSGLTSVTIPNSVTSIGDYAFSGCSGLTSVTIPNSVTSIGDYAFSGCSGLTSVTIPNSVTSIGDYAFYGCSGLTSVTIPNSVLTIGRFVFDGADIPSVYSLIENPFAISSDVFTQNTYKNATLYVPIGTIGKYKATEGWKDFAFIEEWKGAEIPDNPINPNEDPIINGTCGDNVDFSYEKDTHILTISGNGAMTDYEYGQNDAPWFSYANEIQSIEIESGITSIGNFSFYKCSDVASINLPATVTSIGSSAFEECTSLTSLSLNDGLLSIGGSAFEGCAGLKTLSIPSSVNSISINSFKNCKGITDVYCYAESVPDTDDNAFDSTPTEELTLHVPAKVVEAYSTSWPWSDFKEIVPIDADAIMGVKQADDRNGEYYDLIGRKVHQPQKGLYIRNGKKVIVN